MIDLLLDEEDRHLLKGRTPFIEAKGYVRIKYQGKAHKVHRLVLGLEDRDIQIDHINGNKLDNRKENLRICTGQENARNRKVRSDSQTGVKGVSITKEGNYKARIQINKNKRICLGTFNTLTEARDAYNKAAAEYFKEFAYLTNFAEAH